MALSFQDAQAIASAAGRLGVDPRTLGGLMELESGLDPNIWGGDGGNYRGLIQFGPGARQEVGLPTRRMTIAEQIPYVERYFSQRGFIPGKHGATELYRTVLVGNPSQSGTDSNGTNSDAAARRMMPGGDLYQRFSAKFDPVAGKLGSGGPRPQRTLSPEEDYLEGLANPQRIAQPALAGLGLENFRIPGLQDIPNPMASLGRTMAGETSLAMGPQGLEAIAALPALLSGDPQQARMTTTRLAQDARRRMAGKVLAESYAKLNPNLDISALTGRSSPASNGFGFNPMAELMSDGMNSETGGRGGGYGSGEVIEYLTGDPEHPGYRKDHGGGNDHEHVAFRTREARDEAMARLNAAGIQIGSVNDGRHAPNSYHYQDLAFDVPAAQVPVGQEQALARRVRRILGIG